MGKDVIFDYSKAAAFIHEEEIAGIKAGVQAARETRAMPLPITTSRKNSLPR